MDDPRITATAYGLIIVNAMYIQVYSADPIALDSIQASGAGVQRPWGPIPVQPPVPPSEYRVMYYPHDCGDNTITLRTTGRIRVEVAPLVCAPCYCGCADPVTVTWAGPADPNCDGDLGTDADIDAFFACLSGHCCATCTADFNGDGDLGTDSDIAAFWAAFGGSPG